MHASDQTIKNNYDISKERAQVLFLSYDQSYIIEKMELEHDEDYLYLSFLNRDYRIDRKTGEVSHSGNHFETTSPASFNETLTIFDLLCYSEKNAVPSGSYAPIPGLCKIHNASSYAGEGAFKRFELYFGEHPDQLEQGLLALNGTPFGKSDISYRFPVFRDLTMVVGLWLPDDEFPASLDILCDTNTLSYMHYETVWYMTRAVLDRLQEG